LENSKIIYGEIKESNEENIQQKKMKLLGIEARR